MKKLIVVMLSLISFYASAETFTSVVEENSYTDAQENVYIQIHVGIEDESVYSKWLTDDYYVLIFNRILLEKEAKILIRKKLETVCNKRGGVISSNYCLNSFESGAGYSSLGGKWSEQWVLITASGSAYCKVPKEKASFSEKYLSKINPTQYFDKEKCELFGKEDE